MLLSIIIPVYNVADYLAECLDSVFTQDIKDCEVICVNDGSTDNSAEILRNYQKQYPGLMIIDRENGGLSAARNTGFQQAQGKYIYFLDSDDYLYPHVLDGLLEEMEKDSLDLLCVNVKKNGSIPYYSPDIYSNSVMSGSEFCSYFFSTEKFYYPAPVWMYLYQKEFIEKNHLTFKEGYLHEDEDYTPRALFYAERVKHINIFIQYHRVMRVGAITAQITPKHINDLLDICRGLDLFFTEQQITTKSVFRHAVFYVYVEIIRKINALSSYEKSQIDIRQSDFDIMKRMAESLFEKKFVRLSSLSLKLAYAFYQGELPLIFRKLIYRIV